MKVEAVAAVTALPDMPYRGIESFRYVDQPIFFARGEETRKLLRYVSVYRGVLFYGDSGSGKSSLINAGFIPAIIEDGFTPDRLRVQPRPNEEIIVERISTIGDGKPPFLPSNFVKEDDGTPRIILSAADIKRRLQELPKGARPLLIFDQFEEFSTLFEEAPRGDAIKQAQEAQGSLLKVLLDLLRDPALPVKLLFVFREDYLAKLAKLFALRPDLSDQYLRLTPPTTDALHEIIRGSFDKFPGHFGRELSKDLTSYLAEAIKARSETDRLNLSEVQIACLKLWQSDNPDALFKEKGVQGLLEDYLSDSLNQLGDLRDTAVALLSRMVTASGTRNVISEYDLITQVQEDEHRRKLAEAERLKRLKAYRLAFVCLLLALAVVAGAWYVYAKRTKEAIAESRVQEAERDKEAAQKAKEKAEQDKHQVEVAEAQAEEERNAALRAKDEALAEKQQAEQADADLTARLSRLTDTYNSARQELSAANAKLGRATEDLATASDRITAAETEATRFKLAYQELQKKCGAKQAR
ncbi:MAG: hypothetical protein DMF68_07315 [Acidobacteria bacterium]|nr:MAG: hypothetical protein DMF68_07315 [Acidobacteriota bacterium]